MLGGRQPRRRAGPYNLTIPEPTTNAEFTDALARALHRPWFLAAPEVVLRTALGELAEQAASATCTSCRNG